MTELPFIEEKFAHFCEYIWIDGTTPTKQLRSKTKVLTNLEGTDPEHFPEWSFDGSSTGQAPGDNSDCSLKPVRITTDPIRGQGHFLVLCEVFLADGVTPHPTNSRAAVRELLDNGAQELESLYGFEQEYTLFQGSRPLGFGEDRRYPPAQGPYYCGVGADEVSGRALIEDHMEHSVRAGLKISGINAEVMPGQWEFQVGPAGPLEVGDHIWLGRWLLYRLGEDYGINATLDPKPVPGDWNGAGMHANFSTKAMRVPSGEGEGPFGMEAIEAWCQVAGEHIEGHLAAYGDAYESRLTGKHETCSFREFRYGVSDRTASIRIPLGTSQKGYGYLEDRRPNANADPYAVVSVLLKTALNRW